MIYYIYNGDELLGFKYDNNVYYYHKNISGDIIGILDANYNEIVTYEYDSFGNVVRMDDNSNINLGTINPFRYRSYYYDEEIGLYYLNSRYYNPKVGRFINADGIISNDIIGIGDNLFNYSYNNPVNKNDFSGNKPGDLFDNLDDAVKDAALYIGDLSFENDWEYSATIYEVKKTIKSYKIVEKKHQLLWWKWTSKKKKTIKTKKVMFTYSYKTIRTDKNPTAVGVASASLFKKIAATVHTHPYNPGYGIDKFSEEDMTLANKLHVPIYVYGSNGKLRKYDPSTGEDITVFDDLPKDSHYPY